MTTRWRCWCPSVKQSASSLAARRFCSPLLPQFVAAIAGEDHPRWVSWENAEAAVVAATGAAIVLLAATAAGAGASSLSLSLSWTHRESVGKQTKREEEEAFRPCCRPRFGPHFAVPRQPFVRSSACEGKNARAPAPPAQASLPAAGNNAFFSWWWWWWWGGANRNADFFQTPCLLSTTLKKKKEQNVFDYPQLQEGLRQRARDQEALVKLQQRAQGVDPKSVEMQQLLHEATLVVHGLSPEERQAFLQRYGCTGWTPDILTFLVSTFSNRGFVEMGAGHGQWARALQDAWDRLPHNEKAKNIPPNEFVVAWDDMSELPLGPSFGFVFAVRHWRSSSSSSSSSSSLQGLFQHHQGRVLLLVHPPPGNMALDMVRAYVAASPEYNDTVVYVGEGRGGANANEDFFHYFYQHEWTLQRVLDGFPSGGKGYEKVFVLQRKQSSSS